MSARLNHTIQVKTSFTFKKIFILTYLLAFYSISQSSLSYVDAIIFLILFMILVLFLKEPEIKKIELFPNVVEVELKNQNIQHFDSFNIYFNAGFLMLIEFVSDESKMRVILFNDQLCKFDRHHMLMQNLLKK